MDLIGCGVCSGFFYQYFRCYSPIVFQKKNDPNGNYIRKYVPELKDLPSKYIYAPWEAPTAILDKAGVKLGKNYPRPVVDHKVISKENMNRMNLAYVDHKAREAASVAAAKEKKPSKKKQRTS
ncbi:FAD_binding_7-domain-containing protein [Fragilariopsis cylindrus CCMP1102]|uniref:FAD_binding_7-domain-containing protein n=1 Tax=Fragilariopsis cylindrus CCMP1102 TaxID=635003 RepID=A0A1E7FCX3_9STRA|nr:FAD_binding_7-domain-containing protein [Fragilariopsis cylindrus CCMP1102]|eukprot:OEU16032.1 FAD_binding_7-domain-containing protein [Fragilariopsis cylindrus CCMP1102]